MNEDMTTDVDPLSTYCLSYPPLDNYTQLPLDYQNPVKQENFLNYNFYTASPIEQAPPVNNDLNLVDNTSDKQTNVVNNEANITNNTPLVDFNPCLPTRRRKIKKEKSAYFSEKIMDKDFPFYGCAACNICFKTLQELDSHVPIHKDRITSYDLRIKNQIKKRKLQKELKKNKKAKKNVKKEMSVEIEIKPEEGYIGNEKASDVVSTESDNQSLKENNSNGESSNSKNVSNKDKDADKLNKNDSSDVTTKKQERMNLQKIYKCFACQKQFMLSYYLKLHVRSHTDEKPYTCAQCGQAFITASKLGRHNKRYHLAIRHQCRICYRFFSRFEFLTRHFDKKHPDDKLEGEPYDYNAILPYLKELEAELREKAESEKAKAKIEELWTEEHPTDKKDYIKEEMPIEEVKVHMDVEIKFEAEEEEIKEEGGGSDGEEAGSDGEHDKEEVKDENSDSDYFPSSTWAAPPAEAPGLRCEECGKTVSSRSYMRIHMRTHTGERPYKCYICGTGFITSSKMHRHVLTHPESWDEDGVKQESKTKGEKEIKSETERDDADDVNDKKKVKMKAGLAKFAKKPRNKEQKRVYQKRPHACEFCQKRFLHLETLQVHKKCHSGEEVVHACHYCLLELPDAEARAQHERGHTGARPYLCTLCGNTYQKRESMMYHRKSHTQPKSFRCVSCPAVFSAACKLSRHARSHAPAAYSLRYECPVCAHVFNTHYHARMHLATHQREGLIQENNRNEILAMVLQNARKVPKTPHAEVSDLIPPDERSRVCNICGEVFQHFYFLEEHLKSHGTKIAIEDSEKEEEKKHICSVCNKGFKLHYYLKLHSFTHTKEKPFICQQCGKGFITRGKLKRHLETHTGLKKYQCHICYKFFTRPSYLRIHVRTIHGTQDYNFRLEKQYGLSSLPVMGNEHLYYNAILPYLKELEAELREKAESEKAKAKIEELWTEELPTDKKDYIKEEMPIEEVKVHMDVEIKFEAEEEEIKEEGGRSDGEEAGSDGEHDKEEVKDENSDSDYFPSSTWAAPPAEAPGLRCEECGKTVSSRSYMRIHMRTHTGERPYKCYICGTGFITSSKMHRHVLTHPESWDEDGVKQESKTKGEKEIKSETERDDADDVNDKKKVKMKAGLAKFAKKPRNKEQKRVYQKRPHACEFCQKRFLHLETLQVHKKCHSGEEVVHACHYCLLELPDAEARAQHERGHTGARPYLCTLCGNTYQKRESMMYHRKSHTQPKSFRCVSCPAVFSAACKLSRHARSHAPAAYSLRYECPVCAHVFNTHYHARMHLATHQREGLIQENNRNEILAMVLQNARKVPKTPHAEASDLIPPDERSRVCNICGEVFQHFYFLEEHLKSHGTKIAIEDSEKEEEKKHICSVCNKGFKLHYYLKLHSFTHTKEKPFICQQCGKGFITRGKLKRHLETHTGLKKYQCHICYKFFTRPSYLRIHVRTIHGTQDYNFRLEKQYGLSSLPVMGNEHL